MEHWLDRLSRHHTRRSALKAIAVAGAAVTLPVGRAPVASATPSEPCYGPCVAAAAKSWDSAKNDAPGGCKHLVTPTIPAALWGGPTTALTLSVVGLLNFHQCMASAEVAWHRNVLACRGSECGDPAKYPGGQAPRPPGRDCDPVYEIKCADTCCHFTAECCTCGSGKTVCCAAGSCASCCRA